VYTSPIARAQEQIEANGLMRALSVLEPLIKYDPDVIDVFDTDEMARGVFDIFSVNPKFLKDQKDETVIRADRRKAEKDKQDAENLRAAGQGADALARGQATAQETGAGDFGMLQ